MASTRTRVRSKRKAAAYRFSRVHHALDVGMCLTVKLDTGDPARALFRQSALDSACGLHVLSMVLVILGLAKRSALEDMSYRKFGVAANVWQAFKETAFCGLDEREFVELTDKLNLPVQLTMRCQGDDVDTFAMACAMRGELIALEFESIKNQRTKHWGLCIGCDGRMIGRVATADTLLLLDPSASEPFYRAWNARLSAPATRSGRSKTKKAIAWQYESPDWSSEPVRLLAAIRFRLTN